MACRGRATVRLGRAADHCRQGRGRFLALARSAANGRTHLEFIVAPDEAPDLADRLAELGCRPPGVCAAAGAW